MLGFQWRMLSSVLETELRALHTVGKCSILPLNCSICKGDFGFFGDLVPCFSGLQEDDLFGVMRSLAFCLSRFTYRKFPSNLTLASTALIHCLS